MDHDILLLKKKVKQLEKQLCDRTRNYLYHFKKSPAKKPNHTNHQSTQTESLDQSIEELQTELNAQDYCFDKVNLDQLNHTSPLLAPTTPIDSIHQNQLNSSSSPLDLNLSGQQSSDNNSKLQKFAKPFEITTEELENQADIQNLALEIQLMKQQLQNSKTPKNIQSFKFQFLQNTLLTTPGKQSNMEFSKKRQCDTIQEEIDLKSNAESNQKAIECEHLSKENKIMKKEIKKLKSQLENQVQASSETKAALLISQEQNYKFRLKIQRLNKEIQILTGASTDSDVQRYEKPLIFESEEPAFSVDSEKSQSTKEELEKFKSQAEKYEEHIFILQGVKRDYLKKCIQAKQEIFKLKQENEGLRGEIEKLKNLIGDTGNEPIMRSAGQQKGEQDVEYLEQVKQKIHEISNCLPVGEKQELCLFKPDTGEDSLKVLERILNFCRGVQQWQKQRIQRIETQRANLLKVISGVLMRHPQTKNAMTEQIQQIDELKYLVNYLNKQPRSNKSARVLNELSSCEELTPGKAQAGDIPWVMRFGM